jgi:chromosome segregation ATPase
MATTSSLSLQEITHSLDFINKMEATLEQYPPSKAYLTQLFHKFDTGDHICTRSCCPKPDVAEEKADAVMTSRLRLEAKMCSRALFYIQSVETDLQVMRQVLEATETHRSRTQAKQMWTEHELANTQQELKTTQYELATTKQALTAMERDLTTKQLSLKMTELGLSATESKLKATEQALAATQRELALSEHGRRVTEWSWDILCQVQTKWKAAIKKTGSDCQAMETAEGEFGVCLTEDLLARMEKIEGEACSNGRLEDL